MSALIVMWMTFCGQVHCNVAGNWIDLLLHCSFDIRLVYGQYHGRSQGFLPPRSIERSIEANCTSEPVCSWHVIECLLWSLEGRNTMHPFNIICWGPSPPSAKPNTPKWSCQMELHVRWTSPIQAFAHTKQTLDYNCWVKIKNIPLDLIIKCSS